MSIEPPNPLKTLAGPTMGTRFSVQIARDAAPDMDDLYRVLHAAVSAVDQQMSPWLASSDLNRLNQAPLGQGVGVPFQFMEVLQEALEIERASGGAFSPSIGAHVHHWGFSSSKGGQGVAPQPPMQSAEALDLDPDHGQIIKRHPVQIDLCGIAKGYGVDELARVLHENGIHDFVASIDGEVATCGAPPQAEGWTVALEYPDPTKRRVHRVFECRDVCLATSGGYRHFRQTQDQLVTHTINPFTGVPCADATTSVSVAAERCSTADAWATALLVAGTEDGLKMAHQHDLNALFLEPGRCVANGAFSHLV